MLPPHLAGKSIAPLTGPADECRIDSTLIRGFDELICARCHFACCSIFKSADPAKRARAIVEAVANYNDPKVLAKVSEDLGEAMVGINCEDMTVRYAKREAGNLEDGEAQHPSKRSKPHGTW